jgi:hypothetical protein
VPDRELATSLKQAGAIFGARPEGHDLRVGTMGGRFDRLRWFELPEVRLTQAKSRLD